MKKSQTVFDEVGYNLSEKVKNLIYSLDAPSIANDTTEELESERKNLETENAALKSENERLMAMCDRVIGERDKLKAELDGMTEDAE